MKNEQSQKPKIGITIGDINGIGIEVIIKTLMDERMLDVCTPIIYGSSKAISYHRRALDLEDFSFKIIRGLDSIGNKAVNVFNCWEDEVPITIGKPSEAAGECAYKALEFAAEDLYNDKIDGMVTAPINKKAMQGNNFNFPGHTEYLMEKFSGTDCLMFFVSENLKVGVVTGHIALKEVASTITKEVVLSKLEVMYYSLRKDFGISKPKIAVLGLNPHLGEEGMFGAEEEEALIPAIEFAKGEDILVFNPFSADTFFGSGNYENFDGILAMYHDQGIIPFKTLCFGNGVNFTAGLKVVRTSPDHGTGYGIAGKNKANESSFREAIFSAIDIIRNRNGFLEMTNNNPAVIEQ